MLCHRITLGALRGASHRLKLRALVDARSLTEATSRIALIHQIDRSVTLLIILMVMDLCLVELDSLLHWAIS